MKGAKPGWILCAVSLFIAACLQGGLSQAASAWGAGPSFLLLVLGVYSIRLSRVGAMTLGFFQGLLMGGLVGADVQHFVAGGVIAGLVIASIASQGIDFSLYSAVLFAVVAAVISGSIHTILAPPPHLVAALGDTLLTAVYNGVLAVPVFFLFRKKWALSAR